MEEDNSPTLTIAIVSYNTRDLLVACLDAVRNTVKKTNYRVVVLDNASSDNSADAVEELYPEVELIRSTENLGFAEGNNEIARRTTSKWLLLLNPDTEAHDHAIDELVNFAEAHPDKGIYGGRTVFPDGSLNAASCWNKITPWSSFCHAFGLSNIFPRHNLFDTEALGSWQRNSVRDVDIISGCFFLIQTSTWEELNGFNSKYWMYGEEADLCLRAHKQGLQPCITPNATIMHLVGASSQTKAAKIIMVAKARSTLIKDHWTSNRWFGSLMLWVWCANRLAGATAIRAFGGSADQHERWSTVWRARKEWLRGY